MLTTTPLPAAAQPIRPGYLQLILIDTPTLRRRAIPQAWLNHIISLAWLAAMLILLVLL